MAHRFEKGKSLFFVFKNGFSVQDSQLKPRYYLALEKAKQYLPYGDEIVEYALVKHGRWVLCYDEVEGCGDGCSACGYEHYGASIDHYHYCPNCGAKMDLED